MLLRVHQLVEVHFRLSLMPKKWSNELPRLAYARLARAEAIAKFTEIASTLALTPPGARSLTRRATMLELKDETFRATLDQLRMQISQFKKRVSPQKS